MLPTCSTIVNNYLLFVIYSACAISTDIVANTSFYLFAGFLCKNSPDKSEYSLLWDHELDAKLNTGDAGSAKVYYHMVENPIEVSLEILHVNVWRK